MNPVYQGRGAWRCLASPMAEEGGGYRWAALVRRLSLSTYIARPLLPNRRLRQKIRRQMQEDFRSDLRRAIKQFGLEASLQRGVMRCIVALAVILAGFLVWIAIRH